MERIVKLFQEGGRHKLCSFSPSTVKVIISWSTRCTCYLQRCISYFDAPARSQVNIQENKHLRKATVECGERHFVEVSPLQMDSPSCDIYRLSSLLSNLGAVTDVNIHDLVKLRRGFSQLSFIYVLFSFNIFFITHFWVVLSFKPPLDHNTFLVPC